MNVAINTPAPINATFETPSKINVVFGVPEQINVSIAGLIVGSGAGNPNMVLGEVPAGILNGANTVFTTAFDFIPGKESVYLNGMLQKIVDDYLTSGTKTIQFDVSPGSLETILVNYLKS